MQDKVSRGAAESPQSDTSPTLRSGLQSQRRATSLLLRIWSDADQPTEATSPLRAYVRELGRGQDHYFGSIDALCVYLQSEWSCADQGVGTGSTGAGRQDSQEPRTALRPGDFRARR